MSAKEFVSFVTSPSFVYSKTGLFFEFELIKIVKKAKLSLDLWKGHPQDPLYGPGILSGSVTR